MIGYGKILLNGYGERPENAVLRTEMESGAKQAKIRSRVLVARPLTIDYSNSEYADFKTWLRDTLNMGASFFFWEDPRDGTSKLTRIVRGEYEAKAYAPADGAEIRWRVSLQAETWE